MNIKSLEVLWKSYALVVKKQNLFQTFLNQTTQKMATAISVNNVTTNIKKTQPNAQNGLSDITTNTKKHGQRCLCGNKQDTVH